MSNFVRKTTLTINGKANDVLEKSTTKNVHHGDSLADGNIYDIIENIKIKLTTMGGYFEANGKLKSSSLPSHNHTKSQITDFPTTWSWNNISGKPNTFTPSSHSHGKSDITDFPTTWSWSNISGKPTTFTPSSHSHGKSDITDFPTTWAWSNISGKPSTFTPSSHTHPASQITGLNTGGDVDNTNGIADLSRALLWNDDYNSPSSAYLYDVNETPSSGDKGSVLCSAGTPNSDIYAVPTANIKVGSATSADTANKAKALTTKHVTNTAISTDGSFTITFSDGTTSKGKIATSSGGSSAKTNLFVIEGLVGSSVNNDFIINVEAYLANYYNYYGTNTAISSGRHMKVYNKNYQFFKNSSHEEINLGGSADRGSSLAQQGNTTQYQRGSAILNIKTCSNETTTLNNYITSKSVNLNFPWSVIIAYPFWDISLSGSTLSIVPYSWSDVITGFRNITCMVPKSRAEKFDDLKNFMNKNHNLSSDYQW